LYDDMEIGIIMNCLSIRPYLKMRSAGKVDIVGIRYEDLVGKPRESIRRILVFCGLPNELVEHGLRAFDVDSQKNSPLAKSISVLLPELKVTPESIERANRMLKKHGLPLIGEEMVLEGTITYKK